MGVAFPTISQDEKNATVRAALEGALTGSTLQNCMEAVSRKPRWQPH